MLSITFTPLVPAALLAVLAVLAAIVAAAGLVLRGPATLVRALALSLVLLGLANPSLVREDRERVKDVVAVIVDRSVSQTLAERAAQTTRARAEVERKLGSLADVEPRFVDVTAPGRPGRNASVCGADERRSPTCRASASPASSSSPTASCTTSPRRPRCSASRRRCMRWSPAAPDERDRRIALIEAPRFGIVGKDQNIKVEVSERGGPGRARLSIRRDGQLLANIEVATNRPISIPVRIEHGGPNVVELEVEPLAGELTAANNRAVVTIEGIREKLRVLLVSGEPHAGERTWRNLLKSDANVDLVHFTILRPPEKQDTTPINELSLIAFPTRELFQQKIKEFDLIIFDRYANQSVLPTLYYDNIVRYVREGGALMVAAGPEYTGAVSLARTPLSAVLPARPDGRIVEQPYRAARDDDRPAPSGDPRAAGQRSESAQLGRVAAAHRRAGAAGHRRHGGRERPAAHRAGARAEGPRRAALVRPRLAVGTQFPRRRPASRSAAAHGALADEGAGARGGGAARARARGRDILIERQTMADDPGSVTVKAPSGGETSVALRPDKPGLFRATTARAGARPHRLTSGTSSPSPASGRRIPSSSPTCSATRSGCAGLAEATGGSVRRIGEQQGEGVNMPRIVPVTVRLAFFRRRLDRAATQRQRHRARRLSDPARPRTARARRAARRHPGHVARRGPAGEEHDVEHNRFSGSCANQRQ